VSTEVFIGLIPVAVILAIAVTDHFMDRDEEDGE
jgi:hypothetical protein